MSMDTMKPLRRFRRTIIQAAILFSLSFILISPDTLSRAQQKQDASRQTLSARRPGDLVMLTVTVTDRRRNYVKGLTQFNFTVSDGKQEQQIKAFNSEDAPVSVGILLDTSMSVGTTKLKSIREAINGFFQLSDKTNEYFLIGFDTQPKLLHDWTNDTESLLKQLDAVRLNTGTALYDACYLALEKVRRGRHRKHVVIIVSDGLDSTSKRSLAELKRLSEESGVLLYSVGVPGAGYPGGLLAREGQNILNELSTNTGGAVFFPDGEKQLGAIFDMIAIELRNQYSIGFVPTADDGKRHSLRVQVDPPPNAPREMQSLNVRSRKSFYAQTKQP
jgi:Ca-activated chloride channel family protein